MKDLCWKIEFFARFVWYEVACWVLKRRIKKAWVRMGEVQEELDRIKSMT